MLAVKSMDLRENFKAICDKAYGGETIIISRPRNENVIMLSENEYNEFLKARQNAQYLQMLDYSMEEARQKKYVVKSMAELEACSKGHYEE